MESPTEQVLKVEAFRDGRIDALIEVVAIIDEEIAKCNDESRVTAYSGNERLDMLFDVQKSTLEKIKARVLALRATYEG